MIRITRGRYDCQSLKSLPFKAGERIVVMDDHDFPVPYTWRGEQERGHNAFGFWGEVEIPEEMEYKAGGLSCPAGKYYFISNSAQSGSGQTEESDW